MMLVVHRAFLRDLGLLAGAVDGPGSARPGGRRQLVRRWAHFRECLELHHTAEDEWLWPLLLRRVTADEGRGVAELEAEHALLDPLLTGTSRAFDAYLGGEAGAAAETIGRLAEIRELLERHLEHEESLLPMMAGYLSPAEWEAFVEPQRRAHSRASSRWFLLWLLETAPPPARARLLGSRTPRERFLLERFWEPLHLRRLKAAFGSTALPAYQ